MKKLTKRSLSLLLAVSMLFALIPAMAFADDDNIREALNVSDALVSKLEPNEVVRGREVASGNDSGDDQNDDQNDDPVPMATDYPGPRPTEEPVIVPSGSGDDSGDNSGDDQTEEPVEPVTSGDNSGDNSGEGPTEEPVEPVTSGDESGDGSGEPVEEPSGDQETSGEESGESGEKPDDGKKKSSGSGSYKNVTVKSSKGGKVSPSSALVRKGKTQEFTFTPDEGYEVVEVLVDGKEVEAEESFEFLNEDGKSHSIEVKFDRIKVWTKADVWAVPELEKAFFK